MRTDRDSHAFFEAINIEHRALNQLVARIREVLTDRSVSDSKISTLFDELRQHVENHFAQEEQGGYLVDVVERAPQLGQRIERLRGEHAELDRAVCDLADLASRSAEGPDRDRLRAQFEGFVHKLLAHESAEDVVVQQAFTQDVGTKD